MKTPASAAPDEDSVEVRGNIRFRNLHRCPCCGNEELESTLDDGPDFETGLGTYSVRECIACGIQFTTPQPFAEDIHLLYDDRSSHDFDQSASFVDRLRRFNNLRQLKRLPKRFLTGEITSLDYGCGSGFFTRSMREYLPGRVIGSDFHGSPPPLIGSSKGIDYIADSDLSSLAGEVDLIVCRNVLEHTADPQAFIRRLREMLRPGGAILFEVPNRRSLWTRLLGKYNFNYYLPRHLYHYDEASLARHLDGFRVGGRWLDHSPILGKSFGSMLGMQVSGFAVAGLALLPLQILVDAPLRRSSQLVVIAERI